MSDHSNHKTERQTLGSANIPAIRARLAAATKGPWEAAKALLWVFECHCDEAYTRRGRHEPNSICGEDEELRAALAALEGGRE